MGPDTKRGLDLVSLGFNPSVGILWGGTASASFPQSLRPALFQSLGRDSVGWDGMRYVAPIYWEKVSIPRSGFCGVGQLPEGGSKVLQASFNPSVGILWGGTANP